MLIQALINEKTADQEINVKTIEKEQLQRLLDKKNDAARREADRKADEKARREAEVSGSGKPKKTKRTGSASAQKKKSRNSRGAASSVWQGSDEDEE